MDNTESPKGETGQVVTVTEQRTGTVASTIQSAKPDADLVQKGEFGITVYALMTVIAFLLLHSIMKEWIWRSMQREMNKSLARVTDAITACTIQIVRLEGRKGGSDNGNFVPPSTTPDDRT